MRKFKKGKLKKSLDLGMGCICNAFYQHCVRTFFLLSKKQTEKKSLL